MAVNEVEFFDYKFNNLNDEHPKSDDVKSLKLSLKNNQKTALYHCKILERNEGFKIKSGEKIIHVRTKSGVIGCKVGSGKSFVVLGLIASNPLLYFNREVCHTNNISTFSTTIINNKDTTLNSNIILVPHKIVKQWEKYIIDNTDIKNLVTIGTKKHLSSLKFQLEEQILGVEEYMKKFINDKLFLISSTRWNEFCTFYNGIGGRNKFSRIFIDEVQEINIPNSQRINSNFIWFITSSINDMHHTKNNGFVNQAINGINSHTNHLIIKTENEYVEACQNLPAPVYKKIICKGHRLLKIIGNVITPEIQSMLEAEDIDGVVTTLGLTVVSEGDIIDKICKNLSEDLHNTELELEFKIKKTYSSKKAKEDSIKLSENKISEIKQKISDIEKRIKDAELDPITRCDIENPVLVDCCNNKFDLDSLMSLFQYNESKGISTVCPLCRSGINSKNLIYLSENDGGDKGEKGEKGEKKTQPAYTNEEHTKLENLGHLLKNIDSDKRVLIFSEHEGNFMTISKIFQDNKGQEIKAIKGAGATINNMIERYKNKEIKNLFLNAKHNASGLNLQMTDIVIIMHKMSKDKEKQVIGRAQRIGRENSLEIYHLLSKEEDEIV